MAKIATLVVNQSERLRARLRDSQFSEFEVLQTSDWSSALASGQESLPQLAIIECAETTDLDGLTLVRRIRAQAPRLPVILICRRSSEPQAVAAFRAGVDDYLTCPVDASELRESIHRSLAVTGGCGRRSPDPSDTYQGTLIGESPSMLKVKDRLKKVAATDSTVLITGETGTGKECVAQSIHAMSRRASEPMEAVNCAALPETLVESELFGHERGAFTGANGRYAGRLMLADGGTVFFDEIGDMSPYAQAKMLRVLENKEVTHLRGARSVPTNVRFIAATNQNLEHLISQQRFRQDLYYRINVVRINLPPLRERKGDIPLLLAHFADSCACQLGLRIAGFSEDALSCMLDYAWPGNIRELKNVVEMLLVEQPARVIDHSDLPEQLRQTPRARSGESLDERSLLLSTLRQTNWNKSETAKRLNWSRMTVYRKMARYQIERSGRPRKETDRGASNLTV